MYSIRRTAGRASTGVEVSKVLWRRYVVRCICHHIFQRPIHRDTGVGPSPDIVDYVTLQHHAILEHGRELKTNCGNSLQQCRGNRHDSLTSHFEFAACRPSVIRQSCAHAKQENIAQGCPYPLFGWICAKNCNNSCHFFPRFVRGWRVNVETSSACET